jgi:hypothetical protein
MGSLVITLKESQNCGEKVRDIMKMLMISKLYNKDIWDFSKSLCKITLSDWCFSKETDGVIKDFLNEEQNGGLAVISISDWFLIPSLITEHILNKCSILILDKVYVKIIDLVSVISSVVGSLSDRCIVILRSSNDKNSKLLCFVHNTTPYTAWLASRYKGKSNSNYTRVTHNFNGIQGMAYG